MNFGHNVGFFEIIHIHIQLSVDISKPLQGPSSELVVYVYCLAVVNTLLLKIIIIFANHIGITKSF